ncbi:ribonucleotide reductase assembly protein NrdI [Paenibacillus odorifer]|uniref:class Ib ribonucleoside-diphosphate reductase assembly flavoprotein NrdI n=1 Tax=Paenibacillus odorifer TaxID=189426 RepID=UPI00096E0277|nr:class Ib ribonucleoside-diphosphate reductase assembly flavoprotein NrdI [Paenibacillus odorifer]OME55576.1 ribonucleotide reductase assembly protein NrdI [Paenibacillus odorifer]
MNEVVKLLIIYDSLTGNVQRFIEKLDMRSIKITPELFIDEPFVLITYTIGFGEVPKSIKRFLESNHRYLRGTIGSGNRNWGKFYCGAAETISMQYDVPLLHKFELSGNVNDVEKIKQEVLNIV